MHKDRKATPELGLPQSRKRNTRWRSKLTPLLRGRRRSAMISRARLTAIAVVLPVAALVFILYVHGAFPTPRPDYVRCMQTHLDPRFNHRADSDHRSHLVGWINHLIGPFTSVAAAL